MVLKVINTDSVGTAVRAELAFADILFVGEGVTVARTDAVSADDAVIRALAGSNTLDIRGTVLGGKTAVLLGDSGGADHSYKVNLSSTALVKSFGETAIRLNAHASELTNDGQIEGVVGIGFHGASGATSSTITNTGTITGTNIGIFRGSAATEALSMINSGTISGKYQSFYSPDSLSAADTVINKGMMSGEVRLGGGADEYDGRLGKLDGPVSGGDGEDTILGGAGADTLYGDNDTDYLEGGAGNDLLYGGAGGDGIQGGSGNDILDGGTGVEEMYGGTGNDTYIVDDSGDLALEAASQGLDTVKSTADFTLRSNLEDLTLTGASDIAGTGNAAANVLTGNDGKNVLKGMAGNDVLYGGLGVDRLEGGAGNDTYVIDDAVDVIVELPGAGTDLVKAYVNHTLSSNVERMTLMDSADINGTGNDLANILTGNAGKNILKGMAGNDLLDGGAGADRLEGGAGNDTFIVGSSADVVVELAGAGTDTVKASLSHTISANVEKLILTGSANLNGTGNADANTLTGNAGNNVLKGMAGNDVINGGAGLDQLFGGAGKDMFVFASAADSTSLAQDKIFDFSKADGDRIDLKGVDANSIAAGDQVFSFIAGSTFHKTAGELRFEVKSGDTIVQGDANGDGKADFSFVLDTVVDLKASDFLL